MKSSAVEGGIDSVSEPGSRPVNMQEMATGYFVSYWNSIQIGLFGFRVKAI